MNIKKEYVILVTVILALSLYLILRNTDKTHYQLPKLPDIILTHISKIEISKPDSSIVLNKKDNKWRIAPQGYLANSDKVKSMLDTIKELAVTALVSESKDYSRYNLDDDKKITVKAWTGSKVGREFALGKPASSYRHTFVKLAGDHRVYHARGNFRAKFDQTVDNLRDKTVLSFDQSEIQEIHIAEGRKVIAFGRKEASVEVSASQEVDAQVPASPSVEEVWQTADGEKGDEAQISRLLNTLSNLRCEKYIDDRKKEDFAGAIYTLRLKGVQEYFLSIFAKTDEEAKNYPAVSSASDYPFLLPAWQADNMMKKPEEMLEKPDKPEIQEGK